MLVPYQIDAIQYKSKERLIRQRGLQKCSSLTKIDTIPNGSKVRVIRQRGLRRWSSLKIDTIPNGSKVRQIRLSAKFFFWKLSLYLERFALPSWKKISTFCSFTFCKFIEERKFAVTKEQLLMIDIKL